MDKQSDSIAYNKLEHLYDKIADLEKKLWQQIASKEQLQLKLEQVLASEKFLEISEKYYRVLVNNLEDPIFSCNLKGIITLANTRFCQMTGKTEDQITGKEITHIPGMENIGLQWKAALEQITKAGQSYHFEYEVKQKGDRPSYYLVTFTPIANAQKEIFGIMGVYHDITIRKQREQRMMVLAYRDSLTNLPNKALFLDRLNTAISISRRNHTKVAVFIMDIDEFKKVNSASGDEAGNKLLIDVSRRLVSCIRDSDTAARFHEDKYMLLFLNIRHTAELFPIIERINTALEEAFYIQANPVRITLSKGIAVFPDDGVTAEDIIVNADLALAKAKEKGKNGCFFFNNQIKEMFERKSRLEEMLKNAMKNNEFVLYYQPQYEARTRRLRGLEALIRWNNPEVGLVMPAEFIPVAEETGLIVPIGKWVIDTACKIYARINKEYSSRLNISVNISAKELKQKGFYETVINALHNSGIEAASLELEITESNFQNDFEAVAGILKNLQAAGVRIVLDNFGTGNLSLAQLKKLPVNMVKIDKIFIDEIGQDNTTGTIAKSLISLVHELNIEMIAEGVENKEQLDYFIKEKSANVQGYFMAEPVPEEQLGEIISKGILENEAVSRLIQKVGLTYEGILKWKKNGTGMYWDV
ncbi:MAG TPA: EAL domain-containing protein [Desulfitobacteriaceae bacterium]|nr:EAL domain-containing protein [Desulfitobacteriaceae bacterium]